ncbi:MAG TPA: hypothetical protein VLB29_17995 [Nocardioidaceae bacterium]|nr:hypothetical protein [Nocardioidaceae bacterium]
MYARSSTIHAQPGKIDAGIAYFRDDVMPALQQLEGFVGASLIVERDTGRCIVTASYASPEARQANADTVKPLRARAASIMGAESVDVAEWEIAGMHRDHYTGEGACVRTTWLRLDPGDVNRLVDVWKLAVLPALEQLEGFCSASLMVDRAEGRAVGTATFDSRATLEASRPSTDKIRAGAAKEARAEVVDVVEHELAFAHLHAPEMA